MIEVMTTTQRIIARAVDATDPQIVDLCLREITSALVTAAQQLNSHEISPDELDDSIFDIANVEKTLTAMLELCEAITADIDSLPQDEVKPTPLRLLAEALSKRATTLSEHIDSLADFFEAFRLDSEWDIKPDLLDELLTKAQTPLRLLEYSILLMSYAIAEKIHPNMKAQIQNSRKTALTLILRLVKEFDKDK